MFSKIFDSLGPTRVCFIGIVICFWIFVILVFLNASHFGWGFQYLEIAIICAFYFAHYFPIVLVLDAIALGGSLFMSRKTSVPIREGHYQIVGIYLVFSWVLWLMAYLMFVR